jgi:hypothetical protein
MIDKKQLEKMVKHNLKVKKILFIISLVLLGLGSACLVTFFSLYATGYDVLLMPDFFGEIQYTLRSLMSDLEIVFISAGAVLMLFSFLIFGRRANFAKAMLDNYDKFKEDQFRSYNTKPSAAPIVDVKPLPEDKPKGKYDDLINEYQKLYEQGLISKEDLEKKKKELGY